LWKPPCLTYWNCCGIPSFLLTTVLCVTSFILQFEFFIFFPPFQSSSYRHLCAAWHYCLSLCLSSICWCVNSNHLLSFPILHSFLRLSPSLLVPIRCLCSPRRFSFSVGVACCPLKWNPNRTNSASVRIFATFRRKNSRRQCACVKNAILSAHQWTHQAVISKESPCPEIHILLAQSL
jgi:hypothetical protein